MKQSLHSLGIAFVALSLMVGCKGMKKKHKIERMEEMEIMQDMQDMDMDMNLANIAPEDLDDSFFDESANLDQFAFMNENMSEVENKNEMASSEETLAQGEEVKAEDYLSWAPEVNAQENAQFQPIQFAYNSSKIADDQRTALQENIERARQAIELGKNIEIRAYRDQLGEAVRNMRLSQEAANAVKNEMIAQGIPEDKIIALGCGQENPVVTANAVERTAQIRELAPNRRVEISIS